MQILCRKEIKYNTSTKIELQQEVHLLNDLSHTNIVEFYDYNFHDEEKVLYIYMEYCPNGDLLKYIEANAPCEESFIWRIVVQLVSALHLCHAGHNQRADGRVIVHCDLKPENSKDHIQSSNLLAYQNSFPWA